MTQVNAKKQQTVIVGLGLTGLSCARFLHAHGRDFVIMDSRLQTPQLSAFKNKFPQHDCMLGGLDENVLLDADEIIVSPGVSLAEPAIANAIRKGVMVKGDIDLFKEMISKPVVAITGSNGKSTVTTLVGEMAKACGKKVAVAGNIGLAVLDLLDERGEERDDIDLYVLELSSFQLERLGSLAADVAVVLNLSADHMDRYESMEVYHQAKQRIFIDARQAVVNRADSYSAVSPVLKQISYGLDRGSFDQYGLISVEGKKYLAYGTQALLAVDELKIVGSHNIENALAALALGQAVGLDQENMIEALKSFSGLAHRCQFVRNLRGVDYINDSKGTNVGATVAAIEGFGENHLSDDNLNNKLNNKLNTDDRNIVLIAGGESKGADFSALRDVVGRYVKVVVLIGQAAKTLTVVLSNASKVLVADSVAAAVAAASLNAKPGDVVLLSPACASFDMFENYEARGECFITAVKGLSGEEGAV